MEKISMFKQLKESKTTNPSNATANNDILVLTDDIVWEVIVRLPTKSLMRFKSVSKLWNSIIRNPKFVKEHVLHGGAFRGVLICDNLFFEYPKRGPINFFYANIYNKYTMWMDHKFKADITKRILGTSIVKGLIGLYDVFEHTFALCNIATHELLNIPTTPVSDYPPNVKTPSYYYPFSSIMPYHYHLGFDPIQQVHKVLKSCPVYDTQVETHETFVCNRKSEIISLGGHGGICGEWRFIDPPPVEISTRSLWINGALYWVVAYYREEKPFQLAVFHLNNETFQSVPIPDSVLGRGSYELAQIDESPALLTYKYQVRSIDVWTLKDNNHRRVELSEATWIKQVVHFPVRGRWRHTYYAGTLPTGEMLLAERLKNEITINIYCYNHIKKTTTLMTTIYDVSPSSSTDLNPNWNKIHPCYFEENIVPLCSLGVIPRDGPSV